MTHPPDAHPAPTGQTRVLLRAFANGALLTAFLIAAALALLVEKDADSVGPSLLWPALVFTGVAIGVFATLLRQQPRVSKHFWTAVVVLGILAVLLLLPALVHLLTAGSPVGDEERVIDASDDPYLYYWLPSATILVISSALLRAAVVPPGPDRWKTIPRIIPAHVAAWLGIAVLHFIAFAQMI